MMRRFLLLLLSIIVATSALGIERPFVGTHFHDAGSKPLVIDKSIGALRLWDARLGWNFLEPERGRWNFDALDRVLAEAAEKKIEVLLPLGLTPRWAASEPSGESAYGPGSASPPKLLADWENYVRTVVSRYQGRVYAYEIWNEPNRRLFFSGNEDALFRLTCSASRIIREIDPSARIVSSAPTDQLNGVRWLKAYLERPVAKCVDAIGFHFYTLAHEPPEAILPLIDKVKATMVEGGLGGLPIWNTEFGWYIANARVPNPIEYRKISPVDARNYLVRSLLLQASQGIERAYHYAWNNKVMGAIEPDNGEEKVVVDGYRAAARWLTKVSSVECKRNNQMFQCIARRGAAIHLVVWRTAGREPLRFSRDHGFSHVQDSSLRVTPLDGSVVAVGEEPLCLSRDSSGC